MMIAFYIFSSLVVIITSLVIARFLPLNRLYRIISACVIASCTYFIYMTVGSLPQLQHYQNQQQQKEKVEKLLQSMDGKKGLITSLRERLQAEPNSAQGHYLLAKLLASEGEWGEAVVHFNTAKSIEPDNTNYIINYAYALWQKNHNQFDSETRSTFEQLLEKNPDQIDALNMLAMDAYQQKDFNQAISYWRRLLKLAPPGSKDAGMIEEAIQKAREASPF